jgi:DNA-directed RNA polymerase specialized sigma24 family protein
VAGDQDEPGASVEAIERLYAEQLGRFRRLAHSLVGDPELARDVVQDAFAAAVRARDSFRGEGELEGWLWRLVVNSALSERRRQRRRPLHSPLNDGISVTNGRVGLVSELGAAVGLLPERQRLVVFLHYYADLDYARVAELLGISPGTVAATLNQARAALRHAIETLEASHD